MVESHTLGAAVHWLLRRWRQLCVGSCCAMFAVGVGGCCALLRLVQQCVGEAAGHVACDGGC